MQISSILFFLLTFTIGMSLTACPSLCECKWKNGKETVICINASLSHVPLYLDAGTQVLDLTENAITTIRNEEFSNAGLLNLQKIYIVKSKLKTIETFAFKHLKNLIELDLSNNYLSAIPSNCLQSIAELRELKLIGNPIQKIAEDAFAPLWHLVRLELSHCKISAIAIGAFRGLERSLEWLKLDHNDLKEIDPSALTRLQNLHGLELASNRWNCTCNIRPLRRWTLEKNVPFGVPPACEHPQRLRGKNWDRLELDEFVCAPQVFANDRTAHAVEGRNVTISCRTDGVSENDVKWFLRNKAIPNLSAQSYAHGKKMYVVQKRDNSTDLTIYNIEPVDSGTYICAAENKAGRAEVGVTVSVSKKSPDGAFVSKAIFISILAAMLFLIATCLIGLCVCSARKRRLVWENVECDRDENYEKIEMNHKVSESGVSQRSSENQLDSKKNGEYSVVPAGDTDLEEDETSIKHILPTTSTWRIDDERLEKRWNSPEHLLDPEDLHIPRRFLTGTGESCKTSSSSTNARYNKALPTSNCTSNYSTIPREAPDGRSPFSAGYPGNEPAESYQGTSRRFPDVVDPAKYGQMKSNDKMRVGSANDISELFCTLPRKHKKYRSIDSEAPLLTDSRYGSSSGGSFGSQESRMFETLNLNKNRVNSISNIYLNLYKDDKLLKNYKTTPLTNVSILDHPQSEIHSPNANSYNYHAAQLEKFLEEYRCLQKELTKMKKTCDYLVSEGAGNLSEDIAAAARSRENSFFSPNSNFSIKESIDFKNFENELTKYLLSKDSAGKLPLANTSTFEN